MGVKVDFSFTITRHSGQKTQQFTLRIDGPQNLPSDSSGNNKQAQGKEINVRESPHLALDFHALVQESQVGNKFDSIVRGIWHQDGCRMINRILRRLSPSSKRVKLTYPFVRGQR